jgi:succinate dehydrogenase / fumarate reductase cytochrome b subunit
MASRTGAFASSVGTKILIGLTGLFLVVYLVIHIVGNLMILGGPAMFNKYAYTLEGNPLIPIIEILLLAVFLVHVYKTVRMYVGNQRRVRHATRRRNSPDRRAARRSRRRR